MARTIDFWKIYAGADIYTHAQIKTHITSIESQFIAFIVDEEASGFIGFCMVRIAFIYSSNSFFRSFQIYSHFLEACCKSCRKKIHIMLVTDIYVTKLSSKSSDGECTP